MKDLTASLKQISKIINKSVDITNEAGVIIYSSHCQRVGNIVENSGEISGFHNCLIHGLYIHMVDSSSEEMGLVKLILKDAITEVTAINYQQLLINIMNGYKYNEDCCKRFNIPFNEDYIVYCISKIDNEFFDDAYTLILNSFYENDHFWVLPYEDNIVVLELVDDLLHNINKTASIIKDMINTEMYIDICIGVGNIKKGILNIRQSYNEASEAIEIGKKFNYPNDIYVYKDLLAERIISNLTEETLKELVRDMLVRNLDKIMDEEIIKTIYAMFKNNLNISDSSKSLYIHRNTLLYRIEKIQKITGIDIRKFEDAVILKLYLIVNSLNVDT